MKYITLITLLVLWTGWAQAQHKLSLLDAIQLALENNYDLEIQHGTQEIASIRNSWGEAGRYPYLNLGGDARVNYNINENNNFLQNQYIGSATLNWTLFDGFSVNLTKKRLQELEELSGGNTSVMVEGTIQSVIMAYYAVLLEQERLNVFRDVMTLSEDLYKKSQLQKEIGSAVTYDVLQAQNAYLADKASFLVGEVNYKSSIRDLKYLLGTDSLGQIELTDTFQAQPVAYNLADLRLAMQENNSNLKNQYLNQSLLKNAVALAKSDFYPTLSFAGGATYTRTGIEYDGEDASWSNMNNYYGNFTLSFNLFGGGAKRRALKIAEIQEDMGEVSIRQMTHDLDNQLQNAYEFYLVRRELLDVARENMETAELNLRISREKYENGSINSFNFRDIQILYRNSALGELQAIYQFIDMHTSLLRLTGSILQEYTE